jgi:nucleobase transporter 1/2
VGVGRFPIFRLFPIILAVAVMWTTCGILTASGALATNGTSGDDHVLSTARKWGATREAPWIYLPYPCQWGWPTVSLQAVLGLLAAVLASSFESVGDYYACAQISGAPVPPVHAINRGIFIEGVAVMVAGFMGTGNGTTSTTTNIALLNITRVSSRVVIQVAGGLMLFFGVLGKFSAFFSTIPDPVFGGVLFVLFASITSVALTNLAHVSVTSSRNVFVLGFSIFVGLSIPHWVTVQKGNVFETGSQTLDGGECHGQADHVKK